MNFLFVFSLRDFFFLFKSAILQTPFINLNSFNLTTKSRLLLLLIFATPTISMIKIIAGNSFNQNIVLYAWKSVSQRSLHDNGTCILWWLRGKIIKWSPLCVANNNILCLGQTFVFFNLFIIKPYQFR